jgi:hypothetical protein
MRRWATIGAVVIAVASAAIVGVVCLFVGGCGSTREPTASSTPTASRSPGGSPDAALRTPTAKRPLRLWIGGDSHVETLAMFLEPLARETGVIAPSSTGVSGSGLAYPDFFDWPATLQTVLPDRRPEAVVFMVGTNDFTDLPGDGKMLVFGTDAWRDEYRARVAGIIAAMRKASVQRIYWVGAPVMGSADLSDQMKIINTCLQEEVERHGDYARYIDSWSVLAGADGGFEPRWREPDGVHMNGAGAERLARAVMKVVAREWGIEQ